MTDWSHPHSDTSRARIRSRARALAALVAAGMLAACAGDLPATPAPASYDAAYRLDSGDEVRIDVFGDESLSGEHTIDGEGTLTMPLIGRVEAEGRTADALRAALEDRLAEYVREPEVTVKVLSYRPFYIVGEVREPGSYDYVEGMTVINAVALAGGYTYRAREGVFVIERKGRDELLRADPQTPVAPGDVITVRERYF